MGLSNNHLQLLLFCVSDYGEQSNQHDTRRPIPKPPRRLSDGLNARRPRAVACEGQAWQWNATKGPRGRRPIGTGEKWLHATDVSPHCQLPLFPHGALSVCSNDSWPTFTSLFPAWRKTCTDWLIFHHVFECLRLLSFINPRYL